MRKMREFDFKAKWFGVWFNCVTFVETCCWNVDMCKAKSSQSYESSAWQPHTSPSKARKQT